MNMTKYVWILAKLFFIFILSFNVFQVHAGISDSLTVEQVYPGFASGLLQEAKLVAMEKGTLLVSEGFQIKESQLKKRVDAFASYLESLGRKADIRVNTEWVKAQYAIAMDNPVDKARMSYKPTMVEFGAKGCVPCDMMQPILDNLCKKYSDKLNVLFVHVGENQILGARFGIQSIPVQVFYDRNGKEVFRHVGFFPEKEVLKQVVRLGVE